MEAVAVEILATAFFMAIWTLYELSEGNIYGRILPWSNRVTRWKTSLHLEKRGGGADGYIRSFNPAISGWYVPDSAACLY